MLSSWNKKVQCTAWTGIASTLLSNGRTSASLFKLNIGNDSKTSNHSKGSNETKKLKEVDVIIWGECSMISKTALETADFEYLLFWAEISIRSFLLFDAEPLAFAISINKAQGQSFGRVGLYLPEDVFAHGQTYVALSRARSKNELLIKSTSERLLNVVYKEIL
uniref:ATP-dependent DNA helicase n=1 Tax=Caenorhabditis japonica TaxID=281687 RepID=A0A8R1IG49_CAEJA